MDRILHVSHGSELLMIRGKRVRVRVDSFLTAPSPSPNQLMDSLALSKFFLFWKFPFLEPFLFKTSRSALKKIFKFFQIFHESP